MKFFLSHSSKDKPLVEKVYNSLGPGLCHYDISTFNNTDRVSEGIQRAINECSHFVLFASNESLSDDTWVSGELKIAEDRFLNGSLDKVIIFIIDDVDRSKIPEVFRDHVAVEHPSAQHIVYRILSEIDRLELKTKSQPKLYRDSDLEKLETNLTVEANLLPKAVLICGADGFGRKRLINDTFMVCFSGVPLRKFYINIQAYESDYDLYKKLIHLGNILSAKEVYDRSESFEKMPVEERYEKLAVEVVNLTRGNQVLILEAHDEFFSDNGTLIPWIQGLIECLPGLTEPKLVLISARRPYRLGNELSKSLFRLDLEPIDRNKSRLLLRWWLRNGKIDFHEANIEDILDNVEGNNSLIKIAAESFKEGKDYHRFSSDIYKELENKAVSLLRLKEKFKEKLIIALIAECGSIDFYDLCTSLSILKYERSGIDRSLEYLIDFGFIIFDSISYKVPVFLNRAAKSFSFEEDIQEKMKISLDKLAEVVNSSTISFDSGTSISLLSSRVEISTRNSSIINKYFGKGISASLYYRVARKYYDSRKYSDSYDFCDKAFFKRNQLTPEGVEEVLRIKGLSAARMGNEDKFNFVINDFSVIKETTKSKRIRYFLTGFNNRLNGFFDTALADFKKAYAHGGQGDYHILRELSNICMLTDDFDGAESYIRTAKKKSYMESNDYIRDIEIKVMLGRGKSYVKHNNSDIMNLIDKVGSGFSYLNKVELDLVLGDKSDALKISKSIDASSNSQKLLKSRALIKAQEFKSAEDILIDLKDDVLSTIDGQKRSILPVVIVNLIEAISARSINDAIDCFDKFMRFIPETKKIYIKKYLIGGVTSDVKLTESQKRTLR